MTVRANEFFEKVAALGREGQTFAVATVVGRRPPISAHLGDRAIIYPDGRMDGFVGGSCAREIVRKYALESLRGRHARLVSIRPDATKLDAADPEHVIVPMTCASEGAVDVYIEPFARTRRLVVVGATPIAEVLAHAATTLDYGVVRVVEDGEQREVEARSSHPRILVKPLSALGSVVQDAGSEAVAVVVSQGHYDEESLEAILKGGLAYVGLVASRKRGDTIRTYLEKSGAPNLERLRYPAGLDLGARTPPEVALAILAEIVQTSPAERPVASEVGEAPKPAPSAVATAVDPVCHMDVEIAGARHTAELSGTTYYFCCASCRTRFVQDPQPFLTQ